MTDSIKVIGDVHQDYDAYLDLLKDCEDSIQIGDLGLNYSYLQDKLRWGHDVFFPGNHDNYDKESEQFWQKQSFALGNFGLHYPTGWNNPIFYVRGAWSIDQQYRTTGLDWWLEEELSYEQLNKAIFQYKMNKPDIVLTHECPYEIVQYVTEPNFVRQFGFNEPCIKTRTNQALQAMFEIHQPRRWIHGHYHKHWAGDVRGTNFVSLDMLRPESDNKNAFITINQSGDTQ